MPWRAEEFDSQITIFLESRVGGEKLPDFAVELFDGGIVEVCRRAKTSGKSLVIDFQNMPFISSGNIGQLVLINKVSHAEGISMIRLARVSASVREVLRITKLNRIFHLEEN